MQNHPSDKSMHKIHTIWRQSPQFVLNKWTVEREPTLCLELSPYQKNVKKICKFILIETYP